MLCDTKESADEIDIPANFEVTQPCYRVRRKNVNFDYEARDDPAINDPDDQAINALECRFNLMSTHISRLELQVQDYVEVRNPTTKAQLIQVLSKFEKRYSCREMQGSRRNSSTERQDWDVNRMSNDERIRGNWTDAEVVPRPNDRRNGYRDNLVALHFKYDQARRRFVEWAQNEIAVVPDFHKRILFSDEAHFWLNGYVNKQNCRIWSEANPQVYVETPLHPEKLTVWCALWAGGILLQKR
ncbi:uncharacterized protein TNCV_893261 [Trichonephila clavipes]|nr:uncharacterized protein TNCV_893261 [Trichonephila clavipes]